MLFVLILKTVLQIILSSLLFSYFTWLLILLPERVCEHKDQELFTPPVGFVAFFIIVAHTL